VHLHRNTLAPRLLQALAVEWFPVLRTLLETGRLGVLHAVAAINEVMGYGDTELARRVLAEVLLTEQPGWHDTRSQLVVALQRCVPTLDPAPEVEGRAGPAHRDGERADREGRAHPARAPVPNGPEDDRTAATHPCTYRPQLLCALANRLLEPPPDTAYTPTADQKRVVRARDRHCTFHGCRRPARTGQLDHRDPFPEGPTSTLNLHPLCRLITTSSTTAGTPPATPTPAPPGPARTGWSTPSRPTDGVSGQQYEPGRRRVGRTRGAGRLARVGGGHRQLDLGLERAPGDRDVTARGR